MLQFFAKMFANGLELLAVGKTNDVILPKNKLHIEISRNLVIAFF